MFIVKRKKAGKNYYSIAETIYVNDKPKQRIVKYLGTAEKILDMSKNPKKKL